MDFNATIDLIIKDLNEAREIIDDLKKYSGVPVLQVELAKSKCKSAADIIALLKTISIAEVPVTKEPHSQPQPQPQTESKPKPKPKVEAKPQPEPPLIPIPQPEPQPQPETQQQLHTDKKTHIVGDSFSHLSNRFNEHLGGRMTDNDVTEIIKSKQITNLPEAIGINDRFLFIREIFNDNKEAYLQAIERLNVVVSITDARAIIMSYTGNNNENEAVKQLLDLVKRKISTNE
jgi:hypothetical protein